MRTATNRLLLCKVQRTVLFLSCKSPTNDLIAKRNELTPCYVLSNFVCKSATNDYFAGERWLLPQPHHLPVSTTFGHYIWKAIPPEASERGTPNLELELRRVCCIDWMPHPLPVMYTCGRQSVRLCCRPNINCLLHLNFEKVSQTGSCSLAILWKSDGVVHCSI